MKSNFLQFRHSQFGKAESKAPMAITLILIAIILFLGYKFIPVKIKNMKFESKLQDILNIDYAREYKTIARDGFNEYTMREKVLEAAKNFNIPIKDAEKQVDVQWPEGKIFTVKIDYTEEIKLPILGVKQWNFHMYLEQDPHAGKAKSGQ